MPTSPSPAGLGLIFEAALDLGPCSCHVPSLETGSSLENGMTKAFTWSRFLESAGSGPELFRLNLKISSKS